jgi:mRNA interferase MazF
MAMITSASGTSWSSDVGVKDLETAGLPTPSVIRFKLFTLDNRVIIRKLGKLSTTDAGAFHDALKPVLATGC